VQATSEQTTDDPSYRGRSEDGTNAQWYGESGGVDHILRLAVYPQSMHCFNRLLYLFFCLTGSVSKYDIHVRRNEMEILRGERNTHAYRLFRNVVNAVGRPVPMCAVDAKPFHVDGFVVEDVRGVGQHRRHSGKVVSELVNVVVAEDNDAVAVAWCDAAKPPVKLLEFLRHGKRGGGQGGEFFQVCAQPVYRIPVRSKKRAAVSVSVFVIVFVGLQLYSNLPGSSVAEVACVNEHVGVRKRGSVSRGEAVVGVGQVEHAHCIKNTNNNNPRGKGCVTMTM
jgi:hypothetical protein